MDHREDGDHARRRDDHLLCLSVGTRACDAGTTARRGSADRCAQSAWHHGLNRDLVSPGVLRRHRYFLSDPPLFSGGIYSARAHHGGEALFAPRHLRELRAISPWRVGLLLLVVAQDDSLLLPRHRVARLDTDVDGAAVLFFCDAIHDRFRSPADHEI